MRRIIYLFAMTSIVLASCHCQPRTVPVDLEAEKTAVIDMFDQLIAAYNAGDATTLASFLTDDALFMFTDPNEFSTKKQFMDSWAETFSVGVPELRNFGERIIKLAPDGKSGMMVHQYEMPGTIPGIALRNAYYVIKTDDGWRIFVGNAALIPKNEDLPAIIGALQ